MSRIERLATEYKFNLFFRNFTDKVSSMCLYRYAQNCLNRHEVPEIISLKKICDLARYDEATEKYYSRWFSDSIEYLMYTGRMAATGDRETLRYVNDRSYNIKKSVTTLKALDNKY
jgi:hypothetical protein